MRDLGSKGLGASALVVVAFAASPAFAGARAAATIWSLAGNGIACATAPLCGDRGAATAAQLRFPEGVAVDSAGDVYTADWGDNEVRRISPGGTITQFAGNGAACTSAPGCGDGGPAAAASLNAPGGVAVDAAGNLYIADSGDNEVREVSPRGTITRIAGTGTPCASAPSCGDGGAATSAQLNAPAGLAVDAAGRLYVVDGGDNELRRLARGTITRLAGTGVACAATPGCGDGAAATSADLSQPEGVAVDRSGNAYIADWGDNRIRVVSARGTIASLAGSGSACAAPSACGDGDAAASAALSAPQGVAVDAAGDVYVADTEDHELRVVTPARERPVSFATRAGRASLLAYQAVVTGSRVTVRYLLSGATPVSLSVRAGGGRPSTVARGSGRAGSGELVWNRRFGGRVAPRGRYQLTVSAGATSSTLSLRL